ncbi:hypothetical protein DRO26_04645 [Candidatus Bathyarchaeota archaeon]|nr:MAG: hypothetical protein DRO26_04645 [Candidatus Bathyarchaeota archaeon]
MEFLLLFIIGLGFTLTVAWSLGANDAANPTQCAVGSGVITLKKALTLFAIFVLFGALLQGSMVMKTLSKGVVPHIGFVGALAIVVSIVLWILLCTWKGMPISTTHTTVGAAIGYGLIAYGGNLNWNVLSMIFLGMIFSPLIAGFLAFLLYHGFKSLFTKFSSTEKAEQVIKYLLIGSLAFCAYSFGANDVGNATGVYISVTEEFLGIPTAQTMLLLAILGSIGIALGGFTWGYRVIRTVGYEICRLTPLMGLSAGLSNAIVVWSFTTIPALVYGWGLPISTTHASVGSVIGVGLAMGLRTIDKKTVLKIILAWVLTLPCAILISVGVFKIFSVLLTFMG